MEFEKTIYFVRHGQSVDNVAPVFQSPDSPLTALGQEQAKKIASRMTKTPFEALISSPWQRAKETAEVIQAATGKHPEFSELFIERVKPSSINGKTFEDKQANETWDAWEKSLYTSGERVEDGENFDDLLIRVDKALELLKKRAEKDIVVVTHGYFLRFMIARVLMGELLSAPAQWKFQGAAVLDNTGVSALRYSGVDAKKPGWHLWMYNDHSHLV